MSQPNGQLQPLSLMEKIGIGVRSFARSAVNYIPSGLLYSALMIGGSLALTYMTGGIGAAGAIDLLGLTGGTSLMGSILTKAVGTIALGSLVTGGIGAWQGVSAASQQRHSEIEWQQHGTQISPRARGQQRMQSSGYGVQPAPQRGLPQQQQHGHIAPGY